MKENKSKKSQKKKGRKKKKIEKKPFTKNKKTKPTEEKKYQGPMIRDQFNRRRAAQGSPRKKAAGISVIIAALSTISVFIQPVNLRPSKEGVILHPEFTNADGTLNFPIYDQEQDLINHGMGRAYKKSRRIMNFSGFKRFDRTGMKKVLPGTEATAKLLSGATDGFIKVQILSVPSDREQSLKKGAILIGQGTSRQSRLHIRFTKMIHPNGTVQPIGAIALDSSDKTAGLKGSNTSHYGMQVAASAGLHFLGGVSDGMRSRQNLGGFPVPDSDLKNAALAGLSQAAIELATERMNSAKSQKPRYSIPFGTKIFILFTGF